MQGAPVTTLDFDFMFRDTPTNLRKLRAVARSLDAVILRPYYPVSKLYRLVDDATGLQADFMPVIHGVRSFEGLRSRSTERQLDGLTVIIASLEDIIASKRAAGRDRDLPCCPYWNKPDAHSPRLPPNPDGRPDMSVKRPGSRSSKRRIATAAHKRGSTLASLGPESDRQLESLIRRRLALPLKARMHFLRKRLPGGGSCL